MKLTSLLFTILLAICMSASTMFARIGIVEKPTPQQAKENALADEAVKQLLEVRNKLERVEPKQETPSFGGRSAEQELQRRVRMAAGDIIQNFAGFINRHHPSQQEICAGTKLLDAAMKRHLERQLGPTTSPGRKGYEVEELLRLNPGVEMLYTTIGSCAALQPWIDKPAAPTPKK